MSMLRRTVARRLVEAQQTKAMLNPPQSGILGMHTIQDRPVARENQVIIRPMMYVALTYDHRLVDGREAVLFLRRVKEVIEAPARMLVEI